MTSHFNERDTLLCKQIPDLEVLNREIHVILCFNANSGPALWLKWTRDTGDPEEHILESMAAWRCRWLPAGTGVTEQFRRRWHFPTWRNSMCLATKTPPSTPGPCLMLLFLKWDTAEVGCHFSELEGCSKGRLHTYLDKQQRDTGEQKEQKTNWEKQRCLHGLIQRGSCCKLSCLRPCKNSKQLSPSRGINRKQTRCEPGGSKGRGRY